MDCRIIKIGGNVVDNPELLRQFLNDFAAIEGAKILVHGGGSWPAGCRRHWDRSR